MSNFKISNTELSAGGNPPAINVNLGAVTIIGKGNNWGKEKNIPTVVLQQESTGDCFAVGARNLAKQAEKDSVEICVKTETHTEFITGQRFMFQSEGFNMKLEEIAEKAAPKPAKRK